MKCAQLGQQKNHMTRKSDLINHNVMHIMEEKEISNQLEMVVEEDVTDIDDISKTDKVATGLNGYLSGEGTDGEIISNLNKRSICATVSFEDLKRVLGDNTNVYNFFVNELMGEGKLYLSSKQLVRSGILSLIHI